MYEFSCYRPDIFWSWLVFFVCIIKALECVNYKQDGISALIVTVQTILYLPLDPVGGSVNLSPVLRRGLQMSSVNVVLSIDTGVLSSFITE